MTVQVGWSLQGRGILAGRDAITTLARRADALGYDSIWVTDRMLIPTAGTTAYPYSPTGVFPLGPGEPWLDALTAVTYLATVTERITISFKAPLRFDDAAGPGRPPLTGSPAQVVEDLRTYAAAGVQHFVLDFSVPTVPEMLGVLERFAGEVRPTVAGTG
jgi:alkanesulfonate monooxygenase SsuD/methylene tetrahydromethanopterin reductase-like flavin-dependent oxidoreductase (luciferase family)